MMWKLAEGSFIWGGRSAARTRTRQLGALALPVVLSASCVTASSALAGVMAWGNNVNGQLGTTSIRKTDVPVAVAGLGEEVTQVVASNGYSLALLANGEVMAWGSQRNGSLGNGEDNGEISPPTLVKGLSEVTAISSTHGYSLALLRSGKVMAWGNNRADTLGDGQSGGISDVPVRVSGLGDATAVSAGQFHALALLENGTVVAWGQEKRGDFGDGRTGTKSNVPVPAAEGITEAVAVAAGNVDSLVLLRDGAVMSFGASEFGQLGDGHRAPSSVPVPVLGLSGVTAISAGGWQNIALLSNGTVMVWGWNKSGELGDGSTTGPEKCSQYGCAKVPVAVSGVSEVVGISAASNTLEARTNLNDLVVLADGKVMGWGGNEYGQLGDGSYEDSYSPVEVEGVSDATEISAGGYHSLAVTAKGH